MNKEDIELAKKARLNAYTPYTHFQVGACVRCKDGSTYSGCNIENHGILTICGERTAFVKALSEGKKEFESITIVGDYEGDEPLHPCVPCGYCRQFMREFVDLDFKIYVAYGNKVDEYTLKDLLPYSYDFKERN